jgi:hypothetical protein
MFWAVTQDAAGDATNVTTAATPAGEPTRPNGDIPAAVARNSSVSRSVSVNPGETVLTVIPRSLTSTAVPRTSCTTPQRPCRAVHRRDLDDVPIPDVPNAVKQCDPVRSRTTRDLFFKDPVDLANGLELPAEVLIDRAHPDVRDDLRLCCTIPRP